MNKLLAQIARFGVVGVIAFAVDFGIYTILNMAFRAAGVDQVFASYYLISQFCSFIVSVIVNYILSFKYVFRRREDMSQQKEFVIFVVLSAIGLVINEIVLYIGMGWVYVSWGWLHALLTQTLAETFFKLFATAVVMVYNFITRKIFLEDHSAQSDA